MSARRFIISGLVQGVFFRAQTKKKADELDLTGFVKNMPDGSVEIFAEGSTQSLKQLEEWCRTGPPKAKVSSVAVTEEPERHLKSFDVWY